MFWTFSDAASAEHKAEESHFYAWTDELSCGNDNIDADHRQLFKIAERLRITGTQGQDEAAIGNALLALLDYIRGHFAREEALMQALDDPSYADHKFEHGLLAAHVEKLHSNFVNGHPLLHKELSQFLRRWLRYHILHADKQLAHFARKAQQA